MKGARRQRGVSLIEVLMAVLIFSIGLIGLASLLVVATRSNQAAYLRTQVTFLAGNMADRMRANPVGVWQGAYDSTAYPLSTPQSCDDASPCTPAQVAVHDQYAWSQQLQAFLPTPKASISCDKSAVGYDPVAAGQVGMRPPYGGTCTMEIKWSERGTGDTAHSDTELQTFAWEFQP
jgi:type IV pilus assembly protein PilV